MTTENKGRITLLDSLSDRTEQLVSGKWGYVVMPVVSMFMGICIFTGPAYQSEEILIKAAKIKETALQLKQAANDLSVNPQLDQLYPMSASSAFTEAVKTCVQDNIRIGLPTIMISDLGSSSKETYVAVESRTPVSALAKCLDERSSKMTAWVASQEPEFEQLLLAGAAAGLLGGLMGTFIIRAGARRPEPAAKP